MTVHQSGMTQRGIDLAAPLGITRLAHAIVLAWGWRRALIAFAAGAVSTLAMAPIDLWPVLFLTFPVLVWLVDGVRAARLGGMVGAFVAGWWFGFGYFLAGLYWIGNAFLVDAKAFGWLLPIAVAGLPAYLALFTGLGLALARLHLDARATRACSRWRSRSRSPNGCAAIFSPGFPWNAYGYALTGPLMLAQSAALVGLWGLTFIAVAVFASPAVLADEPADTRRRWLAPLFGVHCPRRRSRLMARGGCRACPRLSCRTCACESCSPTCSRMRSSTIPPGTR